MTLSKFGLVLGRFQPFHTGHVEFVEAAKAKSNHLIIGITNPDINSLHQSDNDGNRSLCANNPLTYFDRQLIINSALLSEGWSPQSFSIVPADIKGENKLGRCLPSGECLKVFTTIYDQWGEEKLNKIMKQGFDVEVLWRRSMNDRVTTGSEIREMIRSGNDWKHLVPSGARTLIEDLSEVIRERT